MGQCNNSIEINAPIETVWQAISHFHDLSWAAGVVTTVDKVGEFAERQIGAKRVINGAFHETLIEFDTENFTFSYRMDDGPGPVASDAVNNYIGVVKLTEANGKVVVTWSSSYESDQDDAVAELCNPIYQALLGALQQHFS